MLHKILSIAIIMAFIAAAVWVARELRSNPASDVAASTTPTITPTPEPTPIDPSLIVQVDTTLEGIILTVNGKTPKQTVTCTKFDRVDVNGSSTTATIKGPCRQIMVNGDKNQITADATVGFVFNGTGNTVTYTRFVNGKAPSVVDNAGGNDVQNVPVATQTKDKPTNKTK